MAPGKDGKEGITLLQLFAVYPHNETTVVGEYVHGKAHISGMESFWSMMKRRYHGVYHKDLYETFEPLHRRILGPP